MNELQIFNSEEFGKMRTVTINNEPWFVGKDVAIALGYTNPRKAIGDHVEDEDKMRGVTFRDSIGREQKPTLVNESGLYALIFGSKLESAKRFKRWVTSEVLPAIRKTGEFKAKPLSPMERLQLVQEATLQVHEEVSELKTEFNEFKETMPLLGVDMDALKKAVNTRVVEALGGISSNAYKNKSVRAKVYSDCWNELKRQFGFVKSYKEMKRNQLDQAIVVVRKYELPLALEELVDDENSQLKLDCCEHQDRQQANTLKH